MSFYHSYTLFLYELIFTKLSLYFESCSNVTAMVAACILGEEEMAIMILEFVNKITEEIEAKKVLYEFLGRAWGSGNTILHLAAFMGMSDLVKRLLELGANPAKLNERKYKPVDCADDTVTRNMFTVISECKKKESSDL